MHTTARLVFILLFALTSLVFAAEKNKKHYQQLAEQMQDYKAQDVSNFERCEQLGDRSAQKLCHKTAEKTSNKNRKAVARSFKSIRSKVERDIRKQRNQFRKARRTLERLEIKLAKVQAALEKDADNERLGRLEEKLEDKIADAKLELPEPLLEAALSGIEEELRDVTAMIEEGKVFRSTLLAHPMVSVGQWSLYRNLD